LPDLGQQLKSSKNKLGHYYTVGQRQARYDNKILALAEATRSNEWVEWHWHKEYNTVAWHQESPHSIRDIYRIRAQQLRDKYDYLILSFSGGSDSWTILHTFLSNNIKLDEVFVRWPRKATENLYRPNATNLDPSNILSEWDLTITPQLKYLSIYHPGIKLTVLDVSDKILNVEFTDNIISHSSDNLNPGFWGKYGTVSESEKKLIDQNKKVALIMGVDKPQICVKDNKVYCYFIDCNINGNFDQSFTDTGRTYEFFYWTPDMPEVTHTQAREIYNQMKLQPNIASLIEWGKPHDPDKKAVWDHWVRSVVYPDYDLTQFQAKKPSSTFYAQVDNWIQYHDNFRSKQTWKSMINNVINTIDPKYFRYDDKFGATAFEGFVSDFYFLGNLDDTKID